jgi:hypothetical protein
LGQAAVKDRRLSFFRFGLSYLVARRRNVYNS